MADGTDRPGWIDVVNVERLIGYASHWIGYDFGPLDWEAIWTALPWTDADKPDGWYSSYPLCGDPILTVHLADNPGDGVVSFRFTGSIDSVLAARLETAFEILADIVPADRVL